MSAIATRFGPRGMGWMDRPADRKAACAILAARQGTIDGRVLAGPLFRAADDDAPRPLWLAEEQIKGGPQPSWDQGQAGTCVSFGWGRGSNDLMCVQVRTGETEEYPGADVATEPIYGGSRVEAGGGRIPPGEDGSVGAWAAEFVTRWGILLRKQYGQYDLTHYSEQTSRQWGAHGVPDELEPECRKHPIQTAALVTSSTEAWTLLGHGYPIPICSDVGFESPLVEGFCQPAGQWGHCMLVRGRLLARYRGSVGKAFVIQNSWGDYLAGQGDPYVTLSDGSTLRLPPGCFCVTDRWLDSILRQQDSFVIGGLRGFETRTLDWLL